MSVQILVGDCIEQLKMLPDDSVHCVVTSPPYWGLRDYGVEGQLGLEPTLTEHIEKMVEVFEEVKRVLRPDGTLWLNYGDTYAANRGGSHQPAETLAGGKSGKTVAGQNVNRSRKDGHSPSRHPDGHGLKHKDLCMIPNRLAIALQDAGWWVRSEIIWHKPNPMPESCKDRPTSAHEKVWLLSKSARYYYDQCSIRKARTPRYSENGWHHTNLHNVVSGEGRNARNVWKIATAGYSEAHFATFPPELAERCIKAGCPEGGTVLDPFGGAGTTGLVADRLQRKAILIELNPEYADMAKRRIEGDAPLFTEVAA